MKLEILGSGCANCHKLEAITEEVVRDLGISDAEVVQVNDYEDHGLRRHVYARPGDRRQGRRERQSALEGRGHLVGDDGPRRARMTR